MGKTPLKSRRSENLREGDDKLIRNEILLSLPDAERDAVLPHLELVRLTAHHVLHEPGDNLRSAYFCNTGMISILTVFPDGKSVEVGLVGREGFVGLRLIAGFPTAFTRAITQISGSAYRIDGATLLELLPSNPELRRLLEGFSQVQTAAVCQVAACNRLHEVEERLARWLLMCSDRVKSDSLALTQELLGQMLGTRRSSVTLAAGTLQRAGLIAANRGEVRILKRAGLERAACSCYAAVRREFEEWRHMRSHSK